MAKKKSVKSKPIIYKFRIDLLDTSPSVWREVLVPSSFTLDEFHYVIQAAMGWQDAHLYDFEIGKIRFSEPTEYDDGLEIKSPHGLLSSALKDAKKFFYNYDFGDSWRHEITVLEILEAEDYIQYPVCVGGENACPPEDCGGTPGYEELKRKIADPKNKERIELLRWVGGYFNPFSFDANLINREFLWSHEWDAKTVIGSVEDFPSLRPRR